MPKFPLQPGLKLQTKYTDNKNKINLFLSSGCIEQPAQLSGEKCFFAKNDWIVPSDDEVKLLLSSDDMLPLNKAITLIDIDPKFRKQCWEEIIPKMISTEIAIERTSLLNRFGNDILESLNQSCGLITKSIRSIDLTINSADQESTAFNYNTQRFMGMHIDNHEKLSFTNRDEGFQLLNINFGEACRYFQYLNIEVCNILSNLNISTSEISDQFTAIYTLKDKFLSSAFIDYPVTRIQLEPDQAYIAVTQNLIHDGATNNQGHQDVSFLIAGHFQLNNY